MALFLFDRFVRAENFSEAFSFSIVGMDPADCNITISDYYQQRAAENYCLGFYISVSLQVSARSPVLSVHLLDPNLITDE